MQPYPPLSGFIEYEELWPGDSQQCDGELKFDSMNAGRPRERKMVNEDVDNRASTWYLAKHLLYGAEMLVLSG